MSYCVNCGVELEKSQRACPLCGTEVMNPRQPFDPEDPAPRPYSAHIERLTTRVDRRYTAVFISILLLIPLLVTMFTNLLTAGALTWSLYVAGALLLLFTALLLPLMLNKRNPYLCVLLDGAATGLFLQFIVLSTNGNWFFGLGLPLTAVATGYALLITFICRPKRTFDVIVKCAIALAGAGITVVLVELAIRLYRGAFTYPRWSVYALLPCLILAGALLLLDRKAKLKSELKRRFFL